MLGWGLFEKGGFLKILNSRVGACLRGANSRICSNLVNLLVFLFVFQRVSVLIYFLFFNLI